MTGRRFFGTEPPKLHNDSLYLVLFVVTGLGAGSIVVLLALAGAPTWALIASAFGFSFLIWDYLEDQEGQTV